MTILCFAISEMIKTLTHNSGIIHGTTKCTHWSTKRTLIKLQETGTSDHPETHFYKNSKARKLVVDYPGIIKPGERFIIKNEGMPLEKEGEFGDLYIDFEIEFPSVLGEEHKKYISKSSLKSV